MKGLFNKLEIISSSVLGKKDKKDINKLCGKEILLKINDYKLVKLKNRSSLILNNNKAILFYFNNKYIPTLNTLKDKLIELSNIFLDEGAIGPLQRGANVMAPGIFKYIDLCTEEFKTDDLICIKIINKGILAVGLALIDKKNISAKSSGEAVAILHINNDELNNKY